MSEPNRPFDFEADARSDFATGVVPEVRSRRPGDRPEPTPDRRRHEADRDHGHDHERHGDRHPEAGGRRTPGYLDDHDVDYGDDDATHDDRYDDDHEGDRYGDDRYEDPGYDDHEHDEADAAPRRSRRREQADSSELLQRVIDIVSSARSLPLSASASINRDEVLELLEEAQQRLPVELREARWLRKEREDYLEKMRSDGDEIIGHARDRVEQMVQRTEIAKAAEHRARRIIENAEAEARRMRLETEDYCDHRLARFEIVLERTLKVVASGRARLQTTGVRPPHPDDEATG